MNYKTVYTKGRAEVVEKKSRFIGEVFPVESEKQALCILEDVKKKYWDARHHCWAFVTGEERVTERCSDDGEPSGTAGKPILEVIKGEKLKNVLIVVTRYFGGTLLGTGGLVRAYTQAARECVEHSQIITKIYGVKLKITTDYTGLGKIQYILGQRGFTILESVYTEKVDVKVLLPEEEEEAVLLELTEATNGQAVMEREEECWFAKIEGAMHVFENK